MIGPKPRASHHGNAGENFQESDGLSSNGLPPQRFKIGPRVNNPPKCGIGTPHICRGAVASRCPQRYDGGNSECPRPVLQQSACGRQRCGRSWSAGGTAELTGSIRHVAQLQIKCTTVPDAQERVAAHVRSLEALRRAGIVERLAECRLRTRKPLTPASDIILVGMLHAAVLAVGDTLARFRKLCHAEVLVLARLLAFRGCFMRGSHGAVALDILFR